MRQLVWIIGANWISVKVSCKSDVQWEAPNSNVA